MNSYMLFQAIENDDLELLTRTVLDGIDVNSRDDSDVLGKGSTALHNAVNKENIKLVEKLLELGADVNSQCDGGWTPLMRACDINSFYISKVLIQAGADMSLKNREGYDAFSRIQKSNLELIKLLENQR